MRVIVSVKPTPEGHSASQAVRYVALRDRDEEREGKEPRRLFSARADDLSFWKAERVLTTERTPEKDEVLHVAISFRAEDFRSLGPDETSRLQSLRGVTREAVSALAEELHADHLRWVAGIHRNTDHPHLHLLFHRTYSDRGGGGERRLSRLPEATLARRLSDENGIGKTVPGSFGLAFEGALDRTQERMQKTKEENDRKMAAAGSNGKLKAERETLVATDDRLLEAARRNPSLAGRELIQEIILRGPERGPDERPERNDLRAALRPRGPDDPDYRSQPEQADHLGRQSQELRDLYERGAVVKGDVLIIPAEEYELSVDRNQPFLTSLAYAHGQLRNPAQAGEFHELARTIAGQNSDTRTEVEVFRFYYDKIRSGDREEIPTERLERTLDEM